MGGLCSIIVQLNCYEERSAYQTLPKRRMKRRIDIGRKMRYTKFLP